MWLWIFISQLGKRNGELQWAGYAVPCDMQKSYIALPVRNHLFICPILIKFGTINLYLMQFWEVLTFIEILKFRGSLVDKQYEQNNLGEKVPYSLQNLTCEISNFSFRVSYLAQFSVWSQYLFLDVFNQIKRNFEILAKFFCSIVD